MKKIAALLVALMMLLSACAFAETEMEESPALDYLTRAMGAGTLEEIVSLISQAVEADPESTDVLFAAFQMLVFSDAEGQYYAQLEDTLRRLIAVSGKKGADVFVQCVETMAFSGRAEEIIPLAEELSAANPEDTTYRSALAEALYYADRHEDALLLLDDELAQGSMELLDLRATMLMGLFRYDEAIETYQQMEAQWPMWMTGTYGLYDVYKVSGDFDRAARMIDKMLMNGAGDDLWLERARIRLWNQYRPEAALDELDALLRYNPEWDDARSMRISTLTMLDRFDEAYADAEIIAEKLPEYGLLMQAIVRTNEGEWEQAQALLNACPEDSPYYAICQAYLSLVLSGGYNDFDGAYGALARAFDSGAADTFTYDSLMYLGHYYRRTGNLYQAMLSYSAADAAVFDDPSGLYYLGLTMRDAGCLDEMIAIVSMMENYYPGYYDTMALRLVLESTVGEYEAAIRTYDALNEKFPYCGELLTMTKAVLLAQTGETDAAIQMAEDFLAAQEKEEVLDYADYAYVLAYAGDAEAAQSALEKAEALLAGLSGEDASVGRVGLETTRALICLLAGDTDGCFAALTAAKDAGWPARQVLVWAECEQLAALPQLEALLSGMEDPGEWDLSAMPELPKL